MIKEIQNTVPVPWTYVGSDLNDEEIVGTSNGSAMITHSVAGLI